MLNGAPIHVHMFRIASRCKSHPDIPPHQLCIWNGSAVSAYWNHISLMKFIEINFYLDQFASFRILLCFAYLHIINSVQFGNRFADRQTDECRNFGSCSCQQRKTDQMKQSFSPARLQGPRRWQEEADIKRHVYTPNSESADQTHIPSPRQRHLAMNCPRLL